MKPLKRNFGLYARVQNGIYFPLPPNRQDVSGDNLQASRQAKVQYQRYGLLGIFLLALMPLVDPPLTRDSNAPHPNRLVPMRGFALNIPSNARIVDVLCRATSLACNASCMKLSARSSMPKTEKQR
jgi:hypothetical protein